MGVTASAHTNKATDDDPLVAQVRIMMETEPDPVKYQNHQQLAQETSGTTACWLQAISRGGSVLKLQFSPCISLRNTEFSISLLPLTHSLRLVASNVTC